jgi:hypothetical protein
VLGKYVAPVRGLLQLGAHGWGNVIEEDMARKKKGALNESLLEIPFPEHGLDVDCPAHMQTPGTAAIGMNVRWMEPSTLRERGSSRAGLERFIDETVSGTNLIQNLDTVTWISQGLVLGFATVVAMGYRSPGHSDGKAVFYTQGGNLVYTSPTYTGYRTPATVASGNTVFLGTADPNGGDVVIMAIRNDGTLLWTSTDLEIQSGNSGVAGMGVHGNILYVYYNNYPNNVIATINASTGALINATYKSGTVDLPDAEAIAPSARRLLAISGDYLAVVGWTGGVGLETVSIYDLANSGAAVATRVDFNPTLGAVLTSSHIIGDGAGNFFVGRAAQASPPYKGISKIDYQGNHLWNNTLNGQYSVDSAYDSVGSRVVSCGFNLVASGNGLSAVNASSGATIGGYAPIASTGFLSIAMASDRTIRLQNTARLVIVDSDLMTVLLNLAIPGPTIQTGYTLAALDNS